jgi:dienelactone hydrolase
MNMTAFPIGFHSLHHDVSMNFQMNRWYSWVGEPGMLDEMRSAAPRITNYVDWKREFLTLAENAKKGGQVLRAGFYFRAADFFMRTDDPDRRNARAQFLAAVRSVYELNRFGRHDVPFASGVLPAYRFTPSRSKGTIVFFGGFDSYIEELTSAFLYLRDAGYEVIAFEGPGQGGALNDAGLHMTPAWHQPVKAVLDHFKLDRVTLVGLSMGGCLVMRAAAFEPRVDRVVAYDVYPDALDTTLRQVNPVQRALLKALLTLRAAPVVNAVARRAARNSPIAKWGLEEGMHVTGASSPYGYLMSTKAYVTADVSALCATVVKFMPSCLAMVAFESPASTCSRMNELRHFQRRQAMALLVLGDLGVAIGGQVAHDDWNFMRSGSDRCAQSLGTEVDAVTALTVRRMHDERLKDAAQLHVDGELFERGLGELGTRVVRVFVQACHRNKQWPPVSGAWRVRVRWCRVRCRA